MTKRLQVLMDDDELRVIQGLADAQEILRRHTTIDRRDSASTPRLSECDALHIAVMQARDIVRITSFDTGFDLVSGIDRVHV